jgi:hypothetical protein
VSKDYARGSLRITTGIFNTIDECSQAADILNDVISNYLWHAMQQTETGAHKAAGDINFAPGGFGSSITPVDFYSRTSETIAG